MQFRFIVSIVVFTGVIAIGCATAPQETPQLNQARQTYSQARNDPLIAQYAPVPLHEAGQALNRAENAESEAERRHFAYLAERRVELAQSLASQRAAEDQVEQLRSEQQEMLLRMRAREAEQARQEAQQAQEQIRAYRTEQQQQELTQTQRETEQARAELQELRQELDQLQARQTERGILLTFSDVLFATSEAQVRPGSERTMTQLAGFLQEHPERQVIIEGHTDSTGPAEYNRQLSQQRAQAVADALQAEGVGADRFTIRGLGEDYPVAPNTTPAGRQQNRRVEIIIQNPVQPGADEGQPSGT